MIHPTAIVDPKAEIDPTAEVGPYVVIEGPVVVGPACRIAPHVCIMGHTTMGRENRFHAGCVIGDLPQDLKYKGEPTRVRIGDGNVFRENVTVHRSNRLEEDTVIGSQNFFMAGSHVGHNSNVGNSVILANGALLGGHVTVEDRAFISGNCMVHQFARIGKLSLMQGGAGVSLDLPPFTIAQGVNEICGLNIIGLRRCGFNAENRLELKRVYKQLFRSGRSPRQVARELQALDAGEAVRYLCDFILSARKGVCTEVGGEVKPADAEE